MLRVAGFILPALLPVPADVLFAKGNKGGGAQAPAKVAAPDPESERAKERAASEKEKIDRKRKGGSIATGAQGVLGAAPTSRPELKGQLGG